VCFFFFFSFASTFVLFVKDIRILFYIIVGFLYIIVYCIYIHIYIHVYIYRERKRERERERYIDINIYIYIYKYIYIHTYIYIYICIYCCRVMHLYVIVIFLTHANTLVLHAYDICISLYIIIGYVCCCILYIYKYTYICEHTGILCCLMCVRVYPVDAAYKKLHLHIRDRRYLYSINTDVSGTSVLHVNDMCTCVPTCALCKCVCVCAIV